MTSMTSFRKSALFIKVLWLRQSDADATSSFQKQQQRLYWLFLLLLLHLCGDASSSSSVYLAFASTSMEEQPLRANSPAVATGAATAVTSVSASISTFQRLKSGRPAFRKGPAAKQHASAAAAPLTKQGMIRSKPFVANKLMMTDNSSGGGSRPEQQRERRQEHGQPRNQIHYQQQQHQQQLLQQARRLRNRRPLVALPIQELLRFRFMRSPQVPSPAPPETVAPIWEAIPQFLPSSSPPTSPTIYPSNFPSASPKQGPTHRPTHGLTHSPTVRPSSSSTRAPSIHPTLPNSPYPSHSPYQDRTPRPTVRLPPSLVPNSINPTISIAPSWDPRGFNTTIVDGMQVYICRRGGPGTYDLRLYEIDFTFNMTFPKDSSPNVNQTFRQVNDLLGQEMASGLCSIVAHERLYLHQLLSQKLVTRPGQYCEATRAQECHVVHGRFQVSVFVEPPSLRRNRHSRQLDGVTTVESHVGMWIQRVMDAMLPGIVDQISSSAATPFGYSVSASNITNVTSVGSVTETPPKHNGNSTSNSTTRAVVVSAAGIVVLAVVMLTFVLRRQARRRRARVSFYEYTVDTLPPVDSPDDEVRSTGSRIDIRIIPVPDPKSRSSNKDDPSSSHTTATEDPFLDPTITESWGIPPFPEHPRSDDQSSDSVEPSPVVVVVPSLPSSSPEKTETSTTRVEEIVQPISNHQKSEDPSFATADPTTAAAAAAVVTSPPSSSPEKIETSTSVEENQAASQEPSPQPSQVHTTVSPMDKKTDI